MLRGHVCGLGMVLVFGAAALYGQQAAERGPDAATAAWWAQTTALAGDSMEGRDTGTAAYERAAKYVARQFAGAGLKAAGEGGGYFQRVPMHQVDLDVARSSVEVVGGAGAPGAPGGAVRGVRLDWLQEVTLVPRAGQKVAVDGEMVFVGYGLTAGKEADGLPGGLAAGPADGLRGKVAVFFNNIPARLSGPEREGFAQRRVRALTEAGVVGMVSIDNPGAIEPTHWPAAYARAVTIVAGGASAVSSGAGSAGLQSSGAVAPVMMRVSAEAAPKLFAGVGEEVGNGFADVLREGKAGAELNTFALGARLKVRVEVMEKEISSPNVIAMLPGSDARLAAEYVAVSAHLDGYGFGTPVLGDRLYNGALDDAAYVATLIELAKTLHGRAPARSLLFCVFTGEEKGLLGSVYFTTHPTVPVTSIVADLNLDQLRPIFPLKILTMEGLEDSSLGGTVRTLGTTYGIEIRADREGERNLFRRADNYSFVKVGVPIASFIFGYDPGSPEEVIYRDWYARRYHKPQDDLKTPIDWTAAGTFNRFYWELAVTVADAAERPVWVSTSAYAPKR